MVISSQILRNAYVANMISTIHELKMVDIPHKNEEIIIKTPTYNFQYNIFMDGVDSILLYYL